MMGMLKTVGLGVWAAVVALIATYMAATANNGDTVEAVRAEQAPAPTGTEFRKPPAITVPMIYDGQLRGYVVAKIVFTADAADLHASPIDPQPFVLDEAFRHIYTDGKIEFDHMSKYNLDTITGAIKDAVNKRLGAELIKDVLIDELNYVDKSTLKHPGDDKGSG
jgi:hypothetical protein